MSRPRTHRWLLLGLCLAIGAALPAQGRTPSSAPTGDVNQGSDVNSADLQCVILIWGSLTSPTACDGQNPCGSGFTCRKGFGDDTVCLPDCLHSDVAVGTANATSCTDGDANTDDCLGRTARKNADMNCDGSVSSTDFDVLAAVILNHLGYSGSYDHDGDGRLNFCDDDTDDDGFDDPADCKDVNESYDPAVCGAAAPSAPVVRIDPDNPSVNDDLEMKVTTGGVDPDGDTVGYLVTWKKGARTLEASTEVTGLAPHATIVPSSMTAENEVWWVEVRASDGAHTSDAATDFVTIGNQQPVIASVTITPDPATRVSNLTCTVSASDADNDELTTTKTWYVDGQETAAEGDGTLATSSLDPGQVVLCRATVSDNIAPTATKDSSEATITNLVPSIGTITVTPSSLTRTGTPTCAQPTVTDGDDASPTVTAWWEVQPEGGDFAKAADATFGQAWDPVDSTIPRGSTVRCAVKADDGWAGGAVTAYSDEITVQNSDPTFLTGISFSPRPDIYRGETLACGVSASSLDDEDEDALRATIYWEKQTGGSGDFAQVGDGTTIYFDPTDEVQIAVNSVGALPTDVLRCKMVIDDQKGGTATTYSGTGTVRNYTATTQSDPLITPTSDTHRNTTFTCVSATASDPEGDSTEVRYRFFINGTAQSDPTAAADDLAPGTFARGDKIKCGVSAWDGYGLGTERESAEVTVGNLPPDAPTPSISPASPHRNSDLTCSFTAVTSPDADGDTMTTTVKWWKDDVEQTGLEGQATIATSNTAACEDWYCKVHVSDGTDTDEAASSAVEIPGQQSLYFNASSTVVTVARSTIGTELYWMPGVTLEMWVNADQILSRTQTLFAKLSGTSAAELRMDVTNQGAVVVSFDPDGSGSGTLTSTNNAITEDTWHHVRFSAAAHSGASYLFVDGQKVAEATVLGKATADSSQRRYHLPTLNDLHLGRGCSDSCDNELPFGGELDEVHLVARALNTTGDSFTPTAEATADSSSVFLFSMNEGVANATTPTVVVDRSGYARHGTPSTGDTEWRSSSRGGACSVETNRDPAPATVSESPCGGVVYRDRDLTCTASSPARDPEGESLTSVLRWTFGGTHQSGRDDTTTVAKADLTACQDIVCTARGTDPASNTTDSSHTFRARTIGTGGKSAANTTITMSVFTGDALAAFAPMIAIPDALSWTVSFWFKFNTTPAAGKPTVIRIGDIGDTSPSDATASRLEVQILYNETDTRCEATFNPQYGLAGDTDWYPATGGDPVTVTLVDSSSCSSTTWHHLSFIHHGSNNYVLHSTWTPGDLAPTAQTRLASTNITASLVLPDMVAPRVKLDRVGSAVHLDDLHIRSGTAYTNSGGCFPLAADEADENTILLWDMEEHAVFSGYVRYLGPASYNFPGELTDSDAIDTAPTGLVNSCD